VDQFGQLPGRLSVYDLLSQTVTSTKSFGFSTNYWYRVEIGYDGSDLILAVNGKEIDRIVAGPQYSVNKSEFLVDTYSKNHSLFQNYEVVIDDISLDDQNMPGAGYVHYTYPTSDKDVGYGWTANFLTPNYYWEVDYGVITVDNLGVEENPPVNGHKVSKWYAKGTNLLLQQTADIKRPTYYALADGTKYIEFPGTVGQNYSLDDTSSVLSSAFDNRGTYTFGVSLRNPGQFGPSSSYYRNVGYVGFFTAAYYPSLQNQSQRSQWRVGGEPPYGGTGYSALTTLDLFNITGGESTFFGTFTTNSASKTVAAPSVAKVYVNGVLNNTVAANATLTNVGIGRGFKVCPTLDSNNSGTRQIYGCYLYKTTLSDKLVKEAHYDVSNRFFKTKNLSNQYSITLEQVNPYVSDGDYINSSIASSTATVKFTDNSFTLNNSNTLKLSNSYIAAINVIATVSSDNSTTNPLYYGDYLNTQAMAYSVGINVGGVNWSAEMDNWGADDVTWSNWDINQSIATDIKLTDNTGYPPNKGNLYSGVQRIVTKLNNANITAADVNNLEVALNLASNYNNNFLSNQSAGGYAPITYFDASLVMIDIASAGGVSEFFTQVISTNSYLKSSVKKQHATNSQRRAIFSINSKTNQVISSSRILKQSVNSYIYLLYRDHRASALKKAQFGITIATNSLNLLSTINTNKTNSSLIGRIAKTQQSSALIRLQTFKTFTTRNLLRATTSKFSRTQSLFRFQSLKTQFIDTLLRSSTKKTQLTNSYLRASAKKTQLQDSLLRSSTRKTQFLDSLLRSSVKKTQSADAALKSSTKKTQLSDARLKSSTKKTQFADSILKSSSKKTQLTDSILKSSTKKTQLTDSFLKSSTKKTQLLDLNLKSSTKKIQFTDSILKSSTKKTQSVDSVLKASTKKTQFADSILRSSTKKTQFADSRLRSSTKKTQFVDSILKSSIKKTQFVDSLLRSSAKKTQFADSILRSSTKKTSLTDSFLKSSNKKTQFVDSFLKSSTKKTLFADARLRSSTRKTQPTDSILKSSTKKTQLTDTILKSSAKKTQFVDLLLRSSTKKTQLIDSILKSSAKKTQLTASRLYPIKIVSTNSILRSLNQGTVKANSYLNSKNILTTFAVSSLRGLIKKDHSTRGYISLPTRKTALTNSLLRSLNFKSMYTDSLKRSTVILVGYQRSLFIKLFNATQKINSYRYLQVLKTTNIDSLRRLRSALQVNSDALLKRSFTVRLFSSGLLKSTASLFNKVNALKIGFSSNNHNARSYLRSLNFSSMFTSSMFSAVFYRNHLASSGLIGSNVAYQNVGSILQFSSIIINDTSGLKIGLFSRISKSSSLFRISKIVYNTSDGSISIQRNVVARSSTLKRKSQFVSFSSRALFIKKFQLLNGSSSLIRVLRFSSFSSDSSLLSSPRFHGATSYLYLLNLQHTSDSILFRPSTVALSSDLLALSLNRTTHKASSFLYLDFNGSGVNNFGALGSESSGSFIVVSEGRRPLNVLKNNRILLTQYGWGIKDIKQDEYSVSPCDTVDCVDVTVSTAAPITNLAPEPVAVAQAVFTPGVAPVIESKPFLRRSAPTQMLHNSPIIIRRAAAEPIVTTGPLRSVAPKNLAKPESVESSAIIGSAPALINDVVKSVRRPVVRKNYDKFDNLPRKKIL
jgi:hypothetical protein